MFEDGDARGRHDINKRLVAGSGEDVDYESYQGVLGRPGVDFPVLTGIPNTNFNCRDVGNGYFADLATDCQVSGIRVNQQLELNNNSFVSTGIPHLRRRTEDLVSLSERHDLQAE